MKKLVIMIFALLISPNTFSDEFTVAKQYIDNNALLDNYSTLELNFNIPNTKTFLFYKPYNNKQLNQNDAVLPFTDGVIIKTNYERVIQYLIVNQNGLVKTNDNIIFYDFSESGYSHIRFNGWLFEKTKRAFGIDNPNGFTLQLTNNGNNSISADPPLPIIMWDFVLNYPVKYEMSTIAYPPILLIEYEWNEDINISIARTGLEDDRITNYLGRLTNYEKRVIVNSMFALYGYEFKTSEWKTYFSKYLWYRPNSEVQNNIEILNENQKKLFEYLTK